MARTFAAGDNIECTAAVNNLTYGTFVAVGRVTSDAVNHTPLSTHTSTTVRCFIEIRNTGDLLAWAQSSSTRATGTITVTSADGWVFIAGSKDTGTVAPVLYKHVYSTDTWSGADVATSSIANAGAWSTSPRYGIGARYDLTTVTNPWIGDLAAVAFYGNTVLTEAQLQAMVYDYSAWYQVQPTFFHILDQGSVAQNTADLSGNGNHQSSIVGTTSVATSAPPISYGFPLPRITYEAPAGGGGTEYQKAEIAKFDNTIGSGTRLKERQVTGTGVIGP